MDEIILPPFRSMLTNKKSGWALKMWKVGGRLYFDLCYKGIDDPIHETSIPEKEFISRLDQL